MTWLGLMLMGATVRATIVLIPALVLHALASKVGPAEGVRAGAFGLALAVLAAVLGFVPERSRPTPAAEIRGTAIDRTESSLPASSASRETRFALPVRLAASVSTAVEASSVRARDWAAWVAALWLVGFGIESASLLLGFAAVRVCLRRCRPIADPDTLARLRGIVGSDPLPELLESPDVRSPAMLGRRRPRILLPAERSAWTTAELDAVLAHEWAHASRGDYALGLAVRVIRAAFFHHPMVRFLADRMWFQQELAADALGAESAGGRSTYARSLASLALRLDESTVAWPVRAFLRRRGRLIRRIGVLTHEAIRVESPRAVVSRRLVGAAAVVFLVAAVAVPGPEGLARAEGAAPAPFSAPELDYLDREAPGFVVVRVANTLGKPSLRAIADDLNARLWTNTGIDAKTRKVVRTKHEPLFRLEEIDWIAGSCILTEPSDGDAGPRSIGFGNLTIRLVKPWNPVKVLTGWGFKVTTLRENGREYHHVEGDLITGLGGKSGKLGLYFPDDRTIVARELDAMPALLRRERFAPPEWVSSEDWERMRTGIAFGAIDVGRLGLAARARPRDMELGVFLEKSSRWQFRVDDSDRLMVEVVGLGKDDSAAEALATVAKGLLGSMPLPGRPGEASRPRPEAFKTERTGRSLKIRADLGPLVDWFS